jgi:hypothetical protein
MNENLEKQSSARRLRAFVLIAIVMVFGFAWTLRSASADIDNERATNVQEGDNDGETDQEGEGTSGDAIVGQVAGAVSSGDTSIDATNRTEDSSAESGDVEGRNDIDAVVANVVHEGCPPPAAAPPPPTPGAADCPEASDIDSEAAQIVHEGDNQLDAEQSLSLNSGDTVAGQVIGAVTSAGGSTDIVAANTSRDVEAESGDADGENNVDALAANFVQAGGECCPVPGLPGVADIESASATVVHEGDNEIDSDQDLDIGTGDAVGGQVIGVVSSGDASVDATNLSEDVETTSGDAEGENNFAGIAGDIFISGGTLPVVADIDSEFATLVQEGDNDVENSQAFDVVTGDTVAGQIIGVVAAGTVDVVSANTSVDSETESGESEGVNNNAAAAGLFSVGGLTIGGGEGIRGVIPIF